MMRKKSPLLVAIASLVLLTSRCGSCDEAGAQDNKATVEQDVNYYDFLRVPSSATVDDIKRSYRRLAIELHPDKLPHTASDDEREACKEKFLFLQKAYETLSDDKERMLYDYDLIYGNEHGKDTAPPPPPPPDYPFAGSKYMTIIKAPNLKVTFNVEFPATAIPDLDIPVNVSLKTVFEGGKQNVTYLRRNLCLVCQGLGVALEDRVVCNLCHGQGSVWQKLKISSSQADKQQFEQLTFCQCPGCLGRGFKVTTNTKRCVACGGYGFIHENTWFTAFFQKGMEDGQAYVYESIGNQHRDGRRGHVQITGHYDIPKEFYHDTNTSDLIFTYNTSISALEQGLTFGFTYPTGDWITVDIPEDVSAVDILNGFEVRLDGLGLFKKKETEEERNNSESHDGIEDDIIVDLDGFFDDETVQKSEKKLRGDLVVKLGLNWTDISPIQMFQQLVVSETILLKIAPNFSCFPHQMSSLDNGDLPDGFEISTVEKLIEMKRSGALNISMDDFPSLGNDEYTSTDKTYLS